MVFFNFIKKIGSKGKMLLGGSFSDTLDSRKDRQEVSGRSDRRHTSVVTAKQLWIPI